jgi:hypothetical protein
MTDIDLQRIEDSLHIKLPADYRSLMLAYPFPPDSLSADCLLPNSVDAVLDHADTGGTLPPHSFTIGGDGGEEIYFIDLSRQPSPVFVYDLETGKIKEEAPSLDAYVQQCRDTEEELRLDEEEMARKKWWQFWR